MQTSFSNWASDGNTTPDKGILGPTPVFRDAKDRRLGGFGQSPDVQHPDGYLGTQPATSRRQDKLLDSLHRQNHRSYSRGVHKGERVNPGDYLWPDEFTPMTGIQAQSLAVRVDNVLVTPKFTPPGSAPAPHLVNDGKAGPRGIPTGLDRPQQEIIDKQRQSMLKTLLPGWR